MHVQTHTALPKQNPFSFLYKIHTTVHFCCVTLNLSKEHVLEILNIKAHK